MIASQTNLDQFIQGEKQFVVPLFQRPYCWGNKQLGMLWEDIAGLFDGQKLRSHFIGSIVTMQINPSPEKMPEFLLIDGQQRLTTIFILLSLLYDKVKKDRGEGDDLAGQIRENLLINKFAKQDKYFKLMPTHKDKDTYKRLINGESDDSDNLLNNAYKFFEKRLSHPQFEGKYEKIKDIVTKCFSIVSIVLKEPEDNPYVVFESLNFKGQSLTPADLIRNYFFMKISGAEEQESAYNNYWLPMEDKLKGGNDNLTDYLRHFLMRNSGPKPINQNEVYSEWKKRIGNDKKPIEYLKELKQYSEYYHSLIEPERDKDLDEGLRERFYRLKKIKVTTAYPLILNLYGDYKEKKFSKDEFIEILKTIENFLIRRFVCNIPTNSLNTIFSQVCTDMPSQPSSPIEAIKNLLQGQQYPKDDDFVRWFQERKFYPGAYTELILKDLEVHVTCHREIVELDKLTIEHIMPQTLTDEWRKHLGKNYQKIYDLYLDTIGNMTLVARGDNTEGGNKEFKVKKEIYGNSKLGLNKYFDDISSWQEDSINERAKKLAEQALDIWSYFGPDNSTS